LERIRRPTSNAFIILRLASHPTRGPAPNEQWDIKKGRCLPQGAMIERIGFHDYVQRSHDRCQVSFCLMLLLTNGIIFFDKKACCHDRLKYNIS
jgi:hypothetical protein